MSDFGHQSRLAHFLFRIRSGTKGIGPRRTLRVTIDDEGKTSGRKDKLRGQIGVKTSALRDGCTIGPPAESE